MSKQENGGTCDGPTLARSGRSLGSSTVTSSDSPGATRALNSYSEPPISRIGALGCNSTAVALAAPTLTNSMSSRTCPPWTIGYGEYEVRHATRVVARYPAMPVIAAMPVNRAVAIAATDAIWFMPTTLHEMNMPSPAATSDGDDKKAR